MEQISHLIVSFALNSAWQGVIIVIVTSLCAMALRRAAGRYQHVLWVVALVLSITIPLVGIARSQASAPQDLALASTDQAQNPAAGPSVTKSWFGAMFGPSRAEKPSIPVAPAAGLVLAGLYTAFVLYRSARLFQAYRTTTIIRDKASERNVFDGVAPAVQDIVHSDVYA